MNIVEKKLNERFSRLVPASGKASTVAGEIVRAVCRIGYRYYNDGDRIGVGYGNETVNPAARYLMAKCGGEVDSLISRIWGTVYRTDYQDCLQHIQAAVLTFLEQHPELESTPNAEDMWDYATSEDVDVDDPCDSDE